MFNDYSRLGGGTGQHLNLKGKPDPFTGAPTQPQIVSDDSI